MNEAVDWSDGTPRSRRFDDIYFSSVDGLEESRVVYLAGCGLPDAWRGRRRFTIGELGFGTGLNVLAAVALWSRTRPGPDACLHLFSVEAHPLSPADAARALARWPELGALAPRLLSAWPSRPGVFARIEWPEHGVILDVATSDAARALAAWRGRADAWFLDGFSPAKNPEMWSPELMAALARRSAPGARAASFTVAGSVRRALEAAGFEVVKAKGFGRKSERLEARLSGVPTGEPPPRCPAAVVGAGIAGAALARALRRLGRPVRVFDALGAGAGASGNRAALVAPRLDAGFGVSARLSAQAFVRAVRIYREEVPEAVLQDGVTHLARSPADPGRFEKISSWSDYPHGWLTPLSPGETAFRLGEAEGPSALDVPAGLTLSPARVLGPWLGRVEHEAIATIEVLEDGFRLLRADGGSVLETDVVCIASGWAAEALAGPLGLRPVRGQLTFAPREGPSPPASNGGVYVAPAPGGVVFGATHERGASDAGARPEDDLANLAGLETLRPKLADSLRRAPFEGRAGVRGTTPDHLPLAGALGETGPHLLAGLGGRGFLFAPLIAEYVAARALGTPSPLPAEFEARLDPRRHAAAATSTS